MSNKPIKPIRSNSVRNVLQRVKIKAVWNDRETNINELIPLLKNPEERKAVIQYCLDLLEYDKAVLQYEQDILFNRYKKKFWSKITSEQRRCEVQPTYTIGKSRRECEMYDIKTYTNLYKHVHSDIKKRKVKEKFNERIEVMMWIAQTFLEHMEDITPYKNNIVSRIFGNSIFDFPIIKTGYQTQASIDQQDECEEHFHPRNWAGGQILQYIQDTGAVKEEDLRYLIDVFRQVHITTKKENSSMTKAQKSYEENGGWRNIYAEYCSKLVQVIDNGPIEEFEKFWKLLEEAA